ncbi:MAG: hypothetical protein JNL11_19270 [Bdellovibrionaceae bacterium]|nr:hypothetical protein [Pseudobdellovibrionaceae bacterium]
MKILLVSLVSLLAGMAVPALADSQFLDRERLNTCGGSVELRRADNGDLALQLERIDKSYCPTLRFVDASSGRVIKSYRIEGSSYTLSQSQRAALSSDCSVEFQLLTRNGRVVERKAIVLGWWCSAQRPTQPDPISRPGKRNNPYSYDISANENCKLNINGRYAQENVSKRFCEPLNGRRHSVVSYEWSSSERCKVMIDGRYTNRNVSDYYCEVRH